MLTALFFGALLLFSPQKAPAQEKIEPEEISQEAFQKSSQETSQESAVPWHSLDIPGAEMDEVEPYRKRYLSPHEIKWLSGILDEAEGYRHYIRKRIQEEKLPSCLEYLPIIESSYKPTAKPPSGKSVGMWQFMENSVHPYMTLNEWIDERRDPWKSTDAALSKLKDNYRMFDDWLLAIAAYNCGAGAVKRALAKAHEKTYWGLCREKLIPDHAIKYVPNFLAVSDVIENKEYYKVELPDIQEIKDGFNPYCDFDYITVSGSVSLSELASELCIDEEILERLNLALRKKVTPPHQKYKIRLPCGMKQSAFYALNTIIRKKNADN